VQQKQVAYLRRPAHAQAGVQGQGSLGNAHNKLADMNITFPLSAREEAKIVIALYCHKHDLELETKDVILALGAGTGHTADNVNVQAAE